MSNQSGGTTGPGRFFASIFDAINNCPLEQLDAVIVAMFFFVGGGLLIGAIFVANLVGYFTPIAKNAFHPNMQYVNTALNNVAPTNPAYVQQQTSHSYYSPMVAQPVYALPYVAQQVYPSQLQAYPAYTAQMPSYPTQVQSYPAQVQAYPMPVVGSNWASAPQHFGRPRSASQGWYPFAQQRFGQAEASNQPPM